MGMKAQEATANLRRITPHEVDNTDLRQESEFVLTTLIATSPDVNKSFSITLLNFPSVNENGPP